MEKLHKEKTIKELEKLASEVLKLKQDREQRRPLLIEFCGSPKSGKSTTINSLNIFLKRNGFNTVVLTERASVSPIENKTHPFFNIWTLTSAISEIVRNLDQGKDRVDIIISDRGIFDALCWFEWLNSNPNNNSPYLDDESYKSLVQFILMEMWINYLDLIYVFKVSPETSITREYANLLTEKRGSIMREPVLDGFNNAIQIVMSKYSAKFRNVKIIETDTEERNNEPNTVSYDVTSEILKNLKDLLIEKIGYFDGKIRDEFKSGLNDVKLLDNQKLKFDNRDKVENKDFIQPIVISVITNIDRSKFLVVKKNNKRISPHSPEKDALLVYIGGHVRREDEKETILQTFEKALHREIQEEIGESISIKNSEPYLIYSPDSSISMKHIAICYIIEMDLDEKKFKLVSDEFIMKTGTSKSGQILKVNEIISEENKLESWSRIILKKIFLINLPKNSGLFEESF